MRKQQRDMRSFFFPHQKSAEYRFCQGRLRYKIIQNICYQLHIVVAWVVQVFSLGNVQIPSMVSLCEVEFMRKRQGLDRSSIPGIRKCEHLKALPVSKIRVFKIIETKKKKKHTYLQFGYICLYSNVQIFFKKFFSQSISK